MANRSKTIDVQVKLLVVSSFLLFVEGLKELVQKESRLLMFHAWNTREATEILRYKSVQLIIVANINDECLSSIRLLNKADKQTKILVFNNYTDWNKIKAIMQAGASGYLLANSTRKEFFDAIDMVMSGGKYISKQLGNLFFESLLGKELSAQRFSNLRVLSKRETQVLQLAGKDYSSQEITDSLFISQPILGQDKMR